MAHCSFIDWKCIHSVAGFIDLHFRVFQIHCCWHCRGHDRVMILSWPCHDTVVTVTLWEAKSDCSSYRVDESKNVHVSSWIDTRHDSIMAPSSQGHVTTLSWQCHGCHGTVTTVSWHYCLATVMAVSSQGHVTTLSWQCHGCHGTVTTVSWHYCLATVMAVSWLWQSIYAVSLA